MHIINFIQQLHIINFIQQQFHTTTYIFSFVIMSSFLLKKKHAGSFAFLFQFEEIGC